MASGKRAVKVARKVASTPRRQVNRPVSRPRVSVPRNAPRSRRTPR